MTPLITNDNDSLEHWQDILSPAEIKALKWIMLDPTRAFCSKDLTELPKINSMGTARNIIWHFKKLGLIELFCKSIYAFYKLKSTNRNKVKKPVTLTHMGGKYNLKQLSIQDYEKYLDSLGWDDLWKVHDVVLCFKAQGVYEQVIKDAKRVVNEYSKDAQFLAIDWQNNRHLKVFLHRTGTVTCYLKCSVSPLEVTPEGLADLSAVLGKVQTRLEDALKATSQAKANPVPDVSKWVVTQWHYGKDSKKEISGKSLNITYRTWSGALVRIYLKRHGQKFRPRKEIIEQPRKPLPRAFSEKAVTDEKEQTRDVEEDSNC